MKEERQGISQRECKDKVCQVMKQMTLKRHCRATYNSDREGQNQEFKK